MNQEENRLRQLIQEGEFFKDVFENDLFKNKIQQLEMGYYRKFQSSELEDIDQVWLESQALVKLLLALREPILLGSQANDDLNRLLEMNDH